MLPSIIQETERLAVGSKPDLVDAGQADDRPRVLRDRRGHVYGNENGSWVVVRTTQ